MPKNNYNFHVTYSASTGYDILADSEEEAYEKLDELLNWDVENMNYYDAELTHVVEDVPDEDETDD